MCRKPTYADLSFMEEVLAMIEHEQIAAPAPIEQRWSAGSQSLLSPACSPDNKDMVHSWVGVIMYLPEDNAMLRANITERYSSHL